MIALVAGVLIAIQSPRIQTFAAQEALDRIDKAFDGNLQVGSVTFKLFNAAVLRDVVVLDSEPFSKTAPVDTLFRADLVSLRFSLRGLLKKERIEVRTAKISNAAMNLTIEPSPVRRSTNNLMRIFRLVPNPDKEKKGKDILRVAKVEVENMTYRMFNYKKPKTDKEGTINWSALEVNDIHIKGHDFKISGGYVEGTADFLSLRERSGFVCTKMSGYAKVGHGKTDISNLKIYTGKSSVTMPSLLFSYENTRSWRNFIDSVRITGNIDPGSIITAESLGYFSHGLKGKDLVANVSGQMDGYISDFSTEGLTFTIGSSVSSDYANGKISGRLTGIARKKNLDTDLNIGNLDITTSQMDSLTLYAAGKSLGIGKWATGLPLSLSGKVSGPLNRLHANVGIHTPEGKLHTALEINNLTNKEKGLETIGHISTELLNLGRITGIKQAGACTADASLAVNFDEGVMHMLIDSLGISHLEMLDYAYSGITANGTLDGSTFNGKVVCSDPNVNFLFQGMATLSRKTQNSVYRFSAAIAYADLHAIHIDPREKSKMSLVTKADFTSTKGGEVLGNIDVKNLKLEDADGEHLIGDINIGSVISGNINRIRLHSSFAEGSYVGTKFINSFIKDVRRVTTDRHIPAIGKSGVQDEGNYYNISIDLHDTRTLMAFFTPRLYVADSSSLKVQLGRNGILDGTFKSKLVGHKGKIAKGVRLRFGNGEGRLITRFVADELTIGPVKTKNNTADFSADDNVIGFRYAYDNETEQGSRGEILLSGALSRKYSGSPLLMNVKINPSYCYVNGKLWTAKGRDIFVEGGNIRIDSLMVGSENESILVDGGFSKQHIDTLNLNLDKFDVGIINALTDNKYDVHGNLSGKASLLSAPEKSSSLLLNISSDSTRIASRNAGTIKIACVKGDENDQLNVYAINDINGRQTLKLTGNIYTSDKTMDLKANLADLNAGYLSPFLKSLFRDINGSISGEISLNGTVKELNIESEKARINRTSLILDYTGVKYLIDGDISLNNNGLGFDNVTLTDRNGSRGELYGGIRWQHLKNMSTDVHVRFDNMEVLNTRFTDNPSFYGNVFGSGTVDVTGPFKNIGIDIEASTTSNGSFHIPMMASGNNKSSLLTFREPEKLIYVDPYEKELASLKGPQKAPGKMDVKLRINANNGTEARIELDRTNGNVLSGRGNGLFEIEVAPHRGLFSINGNYNLSEGNFTFVALGIAKRDFSIQEGSSVRFNGDIMDSDLNIKANYRTKASMGTLLADTTTVSTRRNVDCGIAISDKIRNPKLNFTIDIPDLDPTTKARAESALSTEDKIQKQFLSLLISNNFLPDEQSGIVNSSSTLLSNVSEIMAGQLNNIIQKLGIPVDLGLDWQQDNKGTDIFDVAVSTALFNNRVVVNGNIGNRQYSSSNTVVGDLDIEVKIDKPGTLRLNLFSHSADQYTNFLDNSQRNGIGVTYQQEYNSFGEFLRNLFKGKKKRQTEESAPKPIEEKKTIIIEQ